MIQVTKTINITNPSGIYTYTWSNAGNSCVTFSNTTGTTTGAITTIITFTDESCLTSASITITITDSNGCATTQAVSITNPCDNFVLSTITQQPNYQFSLSATSTNCNSFTYQWIYDESLFQLEGGVSNGSGSTIDLNPVGNNFPSTTTVRCKVTDCKGCIKEVSKVVLFCIPQPAPKDTVLHYTGTGYTSAPIELTMDSNCSTPIDWATLQFSTPNGFNVEVTDVNFITITANKNVNPSTYAITYTVKDNDGIVSTNGTVGVQVIGQQVQTITVLDQSVQRDCTKADGEVQNIYIDDKIIVSPINVSPSTVNDVDWSTFEILTSPIYKSPSIALDIDLNGRRYLEYTIPLASGGDAFKYTVCDLNGSCATAATVTVVLECASNPSILDKSNCVACGSTATTNVTTGGNNGGAPFQLNTISIITAPTKGTVTLPGNGTIIYSPNAGSIGTDTIQYTIKNAGGYTSNTATLTIDIICAGTDTTHLVCN